MARIQSTVAVLSALLTLASAFSAPSFCKCSCFTNSTIIPLNPPHEQTPSDGTGGTAVFRRWPLVDGMAGWAADRAEVAIDVLDAYGLYDDAPDSDTSGMTTSDAASDASSDTTLHRRASTASCSRCNRAYCLSAGLPICRGAEEKDVVTMCFQRDSRKDLIIVWGFILGTGGLLGWAGVRRILEVRAAKAAQEPLLGGSGGRGSTGAPSLWDRLTSLFHGGTGGHAGAGSGRAGSPGLRNPFSPTTAEPRGQYAPLAGSGTE